MSALARLHKVIMITNRIQKLIPNMSNLTIKYMIKALGEAYKPHPITEECIMTFFEEGGLFHPDTDVAMKLDKIVPIHYSMSYYIKAAKLKASGMLPVCIPTGKVEHLIKAVQTINKEDEVAIWCNLPVGEVFKYEVTDSRYQSSTMYELTAHRKGGVFYLEYYYAGHFYGLTECNFYSIVDIFNVDGSFNKTNVEKFIRLAVTVDILKIMLQDMGNCKVRQDFDVSKLGFGELIEYYTDNKDGDRIYPYRRKVSRWLKHIGA